MSSTKRPREESNHTPTAATSSAAAQPQPPFAKAADGHYYFHGFGGYFSSEAIPNSLPVLGNTPQKCPKGLYAEQLSGTAFTKVKHANLRTWWYRIKPSADHKRYRKSDQSRFPMTQSCTESTPEQIRWSPLPMPTTKTTFLEGVHLYCGAGDPSAKAGLRIFLYSCNADMVDQSFASSDGDWLIVPQVGTLDITTECGKMTVPPGFIGVVQRGIRFSVNVPASGARGYICEAFDSHFELPPRGVIGANGLANERDFEIVTAAYEDRSCNFRCFQKFNDEMWEFEQDHSPFDVVAWHGNYIPYRYDLNKFCVINTVSYDHLDPSIFCVLTAQTGEFGVACCDFVIFPPRWMVAENTFRPPYYHKNCMSEFMGNIRGQYEAKTKGFMPGGASLHSHMAAHGPEAAAFQNHSTVELKPLPPNHDHLAFMFESYYTVKMTPRSIAENRDQEYTDMHCWRPFHKTFDPSQ